MHIEATSAPLTDGATARLRVMLHNRSAVAAAGSIVVQLVHDRLTPQPLPHRAEVVYLRPDGIAEVTFEVRGMMMRASPYTFFAVVDADNAVPEADDYDNTAWRRVEVCGSAGAEEIADGLDNDCDGQLDEGLDGPPDTSAALEMLRALQRRARRDSAPLVWAMPRLFAPFAVQRAVRLASEEGGLVGRPTAAGPPVAGTGAPAPAELAASLMEADAGSRLTLTDWNGGVLRSGDLISLRLPSGGAGATPGETVIAVAGGGGRVLARRDFGPHEALFTVRIPGARPGTPLGSADAVVLAASTGQFVSAEQGGGGPLRADRAAPSGWETFTLTLLE